MNINIKSKKGASEVIVITLVIAVTVILAGIFFAWLKESSKNKLDQTADELKQASDISCMDASFFVDSCSFSGENNDLNLLFVNNSNLRIFNLMLTLEGKDTDGNNTKVVGRFEDVVTSGQTINLSTSNNFTFLTGTAETLEDLNISNVTYVMLTNGTCPKEPISLTCE